VGDEVTLRFRDGRLDIERDAFALGPFLPVEYGRLAAIRLTGRGVVESYQQVAPRVRALCARYGLPYDSAPLRRHFGTATRKIWRYALPGGHDAVSEAPALRAA